MLLMRMLEMGGDARLGIEVPGTLEVRISTTLQVLKFTMTMMRDAATLVQRSADHMVVRLGRTRGAGARTRTTSFQTTPHKFRTPGKDLEANCTHS